MKRCGFLLVVLMLIPSMASAWWNADWGYKKKITLDVQKLKQDGVTVPASAFALIRLHTGNFIRARIYAYWRLTKKRRLSFILKNSIASMKWR
jgi:hypothetical protein